MLRHVLACVLLLHFLTLGADLGDFQQPTGVAVDSGPNCDSKTGRLYTLEYGNHRIQVTLCTCALCVRMLRTLL